MLVQTSRLASALVMLGLCIYCADPSGSQELPTIRNEASPSPQAAPDVPQGLEVLARGPIHEAFASPSTEPKATQPIPKRPPTPIDEMPPEEKPEGDVVWIGGYWGWDDDRTDFLWVSGCWRVKPTNKEWVPGYWREVGEQWQWVPGFWTAVSESGRSESVTYFPEPPQPPNIAPAGNPPEADMFYVPGYWMWNSERYVWRAGYWTRVRPGYVYVQSHYRWTPTGYVFVAGYWDLAVSRRGVLYAPVVVDAVVVGPRYVYTPYYAIRGAIVLDTLFVRPTHGHYYFGDYYGPRYAAIGFEPSVVYSRRHYEPIITYERWVYRDNPRWLDVQVTLVGERHLGRAPVPPRTLFQQNTIVHNNVTNITNVTNVTHITQVVAPAKTVVAASGGKTVPLDSTVRAQVRQTAQASQQSMASERRNSESASASSAALTRPRVAALNVTAAQPVTSKQGTFGGGQTSPLGAAKTGSITSPPLGNPGQTNPTSRTGPSNPGTGTTNAVQKDSPTTSSGASSVPARDSTKGHPAFVRPSNTKRSPEDKKRSNP